MEISTAITLLTINLLVLSLVIILVIIATTVLVLKLTKVAKNVQETTAHVASITEWFSPGKVFTEVAKVISSFKKH